MNNGNNNIKEQLKNEIILSMKNHIDNISLEILNNVINKALSNVEIVKLETLPATIDDTNNEILRIFDWKKRPKLSAKTANYYVETVEKLIDFTNKSLLKITSMDIEMFLDSMKDTNTTVSLNNNRRNLSAFFTWMRKSHFILENPCDAIEPYKEIHKPIDHMLPEEFEQLKSGCKHKRDRAMIEFMRSTAMRVGEVAKVKISDIDWRTGRIQIYGEKTRTYRTVCLDSVAIQYITDYIKSRELFIGSDEYLFTSTKNGQHVPLTIGGIRSAVIAIKNRASIKRRIYPHLFRKTTASNVIKRGGSVHDAGEYLGHKEKSTAGKYYAYISEEHTVEIFNKYVASV